MGQGGQGLKSSNDNGLAIFGVKNSLGHPRIHAANAVFSKIVIVHARLVLNILPDFA